MNTNVSNGLRPSGSSKFACTPDGPVSRKVDQVTFDGPLSSDPYVGIVGGGIAGLACALELVRSGSGHAVVFDTGEHGVGGRAATRSLPDGSLHHPHPSPDARAVPGGLVFDHAAQYFTATDPQFASEVARWQQAGLVTEWKGKVVQIDGRTGASTPLVDGNGPDGKPLKRFIVKGGFRALGTHLAAEAAREAMARKKKFEVRRPCWVNVMRAERQGWRLTAKGRDQGTFDAVVIAHNGKCANRLVGGTGVPGVEKQLNALRLSSLWVVMVAVRMSPGAHGPEGAFVEHDDTLSWACNNSAKLGLAAQHGDVACWTLISTPEYGKRNKVPQENVPPEVSQQVIHDLLQRANKALGWGISDAELASRILYSKAQLWGAALPVNTPATPCVFDAVGRAGICGDWLTGGSIQAAFESGRALGRQIARVRGEASSDALSVGLGVPLKAFAASPIGEFPGAKTPVSEAPNLSRGGGGGGRGGAARSGGAGQGRGRSSGPSRVQQGNGNGSAGGQGPAPAQTRGWSAAMGQRGAV